MFVMYGRHALSAQILEASLLGAGTALRLVGNAWSMVKRLRQATHEYAPPPFDSRVRSFVRSGEPQTPPKVDECAYGKAPTRRLHSIVSPRLSLDVATPGKKKKKSKPTSTRKKVRTSCGSPPRTWSLVGCNSPVMRFAEHLTGLRAWCRQCLPG